MTCTDMLSIPQPAASLSHRLIGWLTRMVTLVMCWRRRQRERDLLAAMGPHAWRDMGLSDADVSRELDKPFWQG